MDNNSNQQAFETVHSYSVSQAGVDILELLQARDSSIETSPGLTIRALGYISDEIRLSSECRPEMDRKETVATKLDRLLAHLFNRIHQWRH